MNSIQPLSRCTWDQTVELWNQGFQGYPVDISSRVDSLLKRMVQLELSPEWSLTVWSDGKPIGFVLNGIRSIQGKRIAWNGGMGVVPRWRGKGIGKRLMEAALELYRKEQVELATLEAISSNYRSISLYEKMGYYIVDQLGVFQSDQWKQEETLQRY
jgi:ribosomal protein S18 acetylase RimI-like enzyme